MNEGRKDSGRGEVEERGGVDTEGLKQWNGDGMETPMVEVPRLAPKPPLKLPNDGALYISKAHPSGCHAYRPPTEAREGH